MLPTGAVRREVAGGFGSSSVYRNYLKVAGANPAGVYSVFITLPVGQRSLYRYPGVSYWSVLK